MRFHPKLRISFFAVGPARGVPSIDIRGAFFRCFNVVIEPSNFGVRPRYLKDHDLHDFGQHLIRELVEAAQLRPFKVRKFGVLK